MIIAAYGNSDIVQYVSQCIAALFGHGDYRETLKTCFMMAFFTILVKAMFKTDTLPTANQSIAIGVFLCAILIPNTAMMMVLILSSMTVS